MQVFPGSVSPKIETWASLGTMGPIVKTCFFKIKKLFCRNCMASPSKPAVSVKLSAQEPTLISLTMLFMASQPELTILTSPLQVPFHPAYQDWIIVRQ